MSDPGMMSPNQPMTPEQYAQLQAIQKQKTIGAALMANQNAQGANGGIANAGNSILGALIASKAQNQQNAMMPGMAQAQKPGLLSNLFSFGGGS